MQSDDGKRPASAFARALMAKDARALASLFVTDNPAYADGCRPGLSTGSDAVASHLALLCEALKDATISHVDTLVDQDSACIRWMAQQGPPKGLALDAVTWLRFRDGRVVDGRSFLDGALFLDAQRDADVLPSLDGVAPMQLQRPVVISGRDSRGVRFDMAQMQGRVVTVLLASRAVQVDAQHLADLLGLSFGGDARVVLVLLLDASDVPAMLRGIARNALGSLRSQAVRRFREAFVKAGRPVPAQVEELVWFLLDEDGTHFTGLGVDRPLTTPVLAVVDTLGRLAGLHRGSAQEIASHAVPQVKGLLGP